MEGESDGTKVRSGRENGPGWSRTKRNAGRGNKGMGKKDGARKGNGLVGGGGEGGRKTGIRRREEV
jgi:hypothetical protein